MLYPYLCSILGVNEDKLREHAFKHIHKAEESLKSSTKNVKKISKKIKVKSVQSLFQLALKKIESIDDNVLIDLAREDFFLENVKSFKQQWKENTYSVWLHDDQEKNCATLSGNKFYFPALSCPDIYNGHIGK